MAGPTPILDSFLTVISNHLRARDGDSLRNVLLIEPPYPDSYNQLIGELTRAYPRADSSSTAKSHDSEAELESKCARGLPEAQEGVDGGATWQAFVKFMVHYFMFLRDLDASRNLNTFNLIIDLIGKANSALNHVSLGIIILPTVINYSHSLAKLAIAFERDPSLTIHPGQASSVPNKPRKDTPQQATNCIRNSFVTCLNDRTTTSGGNRPAGKKIAVYKLANMCLKILHACHNLRNAEQIFSNIFNLAPPLSLYPASERVTYLYFLGRFHFANGHFGRALAAFDYAFACVSGREPLLPQRRRLLIHLVATSIIMGRFPSHACYALPEAAGLAAIFTPLTTAIAKGDMASFRLMTTLPPLDPSASYIDSTSDMHPTTAFLLHHHLLFQIANRTEPFVWRSLARRLFLLAGQPADPTTRRAATFDLHHLHHLAYALESRASTALQTTAAYASAADFDVDEDDNHEKGDRIYEDPLLPTYDTTESTLASLTNEGLVAGYISKSHHRFAIRRPGRAQGGKAAQFLPGFPTVWAVTGGEGWLRGVEAEGYGVPGWKKTDGGGGVNGMGGMQIHLSGARAVGVS